MRTVVTAITSVIFVVTFVGMVVGILLHSGRGGGLSDMGASLGVVPDHHDRTTTVASHRWTSLVRPRARSGTGGTPETVPIPTGTGGRGTIGA